jgi:uncharacterized protein (TIGR00369 family)
MSMGCPLLDRLPHRSYDEGDAHVVELEITDETRSPGGAVHGGLIASLADRAGAYAVVRESGRGVVTSSIALSYLSAASVGPIRAVASAFGSAASRAWPRCASATPAGATGWWRRHCSP